LKDKKICRSGKPCAESHRSPRQFEEKKKDSGIKWLLIGAGAGVTGNGLSAMNCDSLLKTGFLHRTGNSFSVIAAVTLHTTAFWGTAFGASVLWVCAANDVG
jgi:hypothetical protein